MSQNLTKKTAIIFIIILILIGGVIFILFLPFLNIRKAVGLDDPRYKTQEIVINSYNPFKPRISLITKVEDGYLVTVEDYQRNGLDTFQATGTLNGQRKGEGFDQINSKITGKTLEEAIQIVKAKDQSINPFTEGKTQAQKDYEEEQKKPVECQKVVRDVKKYDNSFINKLYKGINYLDFLKLRVVTGEEFRNNQGIYILSINSSEEGLIKYNIFTENKTYDENPNVKVTKVTKVYSDCREEEIPLSDKPNV